MNKFLPFLMMIILVNFVYSNSFPDELKTSINQTLSNTRSSYGVKGNAASVILPNGSAWSTGGGIKSAGVPIDTASLFRFASYTKMLTSTVILQLHDEGKLKINDSIGTYLDPMPNVDPDLTIKELLNHTSTLGFFFNNAVVVVASNPDSVFDVRQTLLDYLGAPGNSQKNYQYNDTNHNILGLIIEKIIGKPTEEAFRERLFDPLGLQDAHLAPVDFPLDRMNGTWNDMGTGLQDFSHVSTNSILTAYKYSGGAIGTTMDMLRLLKGLLDGQYLTPETLALMKNVHPKSVSGDYGYGLGMMKTGIAGDILYGHGGSTAQSTRTYYCPTRGIGVAVAMNHSNTDAINYMLDQIYIAAKQTVTSVPVTAPAAIPQQYSLANYPNPFNPETRIVFTLKKMDHVRLEVFNTAGQRIATLIDSPMAAGKHEFNYRPADNASGVYYYRINTSEFSQVNKMILLR